MAVHPHAGKLPAPETLENIPALVSAYYTESPDPHQAAQRVSFGTSGHRGSSLKQTFNERHIHERIGAGKDEAVGKAVIGGFDIRECPAYTLLYQFSPKDTGQSKVK